MTIYVTKEDGSFEKFKRSNIVQSLEAMGVDHKKAKELAKQVVEKQRMTEHEIKFMIFEMLDKIDPELADRYYMTKKVHVHNESMQVTGNALLSDFLMEYLDLRQGDRMDIFHGDKKTIMRAYELHFKHDDHETIFMSDHDMKLMDIRKGDQVGICKHHE
ncbi:MAG: ATP cone domain-containing protein [Thermoplasmatota archaeon]